MTHTPDEQRAIADALLANAEDYTGELQAEGGNAILALLDRLAALEAERAAGEARVVGLGNLLCLADNLLMDAIGAFPLHGHTMRDGCILIRAETGEHYDTRQARGTAALAKQEPGA